MISGVILARNEEDNIVDCIHALRPHVGEIILIDMESEDATKRLAEPLVDQILDHPLIPQFDRARNISIEKARFDWFWFVDADERIPEATGKLVNDLIRSQSDQFDGINIPFKSYFCGRWIQHSGWWPGYTCVRVLKRGFFQFSTKLHGGVDFTGREFRLPPDPALGVDHFSYRSVEHYLEKINRYTSTEALQLKEAGQSVDWRNAIAHMMQDLCYYYERNQGFRDEREGWVLAWLSGQYRWLSHAKLLDHKTEPQTVEGLELYPTSLNAVLHEMERELERNRSPMAEPPLGIVWRSPIWDRSGYADEGRCIAKALALSDRWTTIEEIPWSDDRCDVPGNDAGLLRAMQRSRRQNWNMTITNCIPSLVQPDGAAALNVIRTTFEADRIPSPWLPSLDCFDEIWVISNYNRDAFIRSGIAPEKIRVVPSFLDTDLYRPDGAQMEIPDALENRFVFLSVFDWQYRKGWDLLLKAYCQSFDPCSGTGLLLKISRAHGGSFDDVLSQANQALGDFGQSLDQRSDIVFIDESFSSNEMAELYRSVDAFVLPTRGEGWGRPYMEAMACGLPTIGTAASGNIDFMNEDNSYLISATEVDVPQAAVEEIPVFAGCRWHEQDFDQLCEAMKSVFEDQASRKTVSANAVRHIASHHDISAGTRYWTDAVEAAEQRFVRHAPEPPTDAQIKLVWEGEFFAGHSFSNINERLVTDFLKDDQFAIAIDRQFHCPPVLEAHRPIARQIAAYAARQFKDGPTVTVRHTYPPNWEPPNAGQWIHIQPWEFGYLPVDWIPVLKDDVDEIWCPSNYVRDVYLRSGIPDEKLQVIPWGVDTAVFHPDMPARILGTNKSFKFLYTGGTIRRKGIDLLVDAYLAEFDCDDDVCLVIKDVGTKTFYRCDDVREQLSNMTKDPRSPEILYFDDEMTPGQLSSIYNACDCFVAPYRGEGFGLPILEAMACGLPPIIPKGGASDDFVSDQTGFLVDAVEVETEHPWELCGPPMELSVDVEHLRKTMRDAATSPELVTKKGKLAGIAAADRFSWDNTYRQMVDRLQVVAKRPLSRLERSAARSSAFVTACLKVSNDEQIIANCLARIVPFVDEILVINDNSTDRTTAIANEYGARVISISDCQNGEELDVNDHLNTLWHFWISPQSLLSDADGSHIRSLIQSQPDRSTEVAMEIAPVRHDQSHADASTHLRFKKLACPK